MRGVRARRSPFDIVSSHVPARTATKAELLAHVRELERSALDGPDVAFAWAQSDDPRVVADVDEALVVDLRERDTEAQMPPYPEDARATHRQHA